MYTHFLLEPFYIQCRPYSHIFLKVNIKKINHELKQKHLNSCNQFRLLFKLDSSFSLINSHE